jgi:hypothetical protein
VTARAKAGIVRRCSCFGLIRNGVMNGALDPRPLPFGQKFVRREPMCFRARPRFPSEDAITAKQIRLVLRLLRQSPRSAVCLVNARGDSNMREVGYGFQFRHRMRTIHRRSAPTRSRERSALESAYNELMQCKIRTKCSTTCLLFGARKIHLSRVRCQSCPPDRQSPRLLPRAWGFRLRDLSTSEKCSLSNGRVRASDDRSLR